MTNPFAEHLAAPSGIDLLMDNLAEGMRDSSAMLGGGNPGFVPQVLTRLRQLLHQTTDESIKDLLGSYSAPLGDLGFRTALAGLLKRTYGWDINANNIALTNGSQSAFFQLFNLLAGNTKRIALPLSPEYLGYTQTGLSDQLFIANTPHYDIQGDQEFVYTPRFDTLDLDAAAALCVSSPCNPSGKVLTSDEMAQLKQLATHQDIPLIIDNAYGSPFPSILFTDATIPWDDNTILVLSLSKLGLPAARTGIIISNQDLIAQIGRINAVTALAPCSTAACLLTPLVESGEIISLAHDYIRPFYAKRAIRAQQYIHQLLTGLPCYTHKVEGGIFLWLWMADLPITSYELYARCKKAGVVIVPGAFFYPGASEPEDHRCIRISYAGDQHTVERGLELIATEIHKAYSGHH